MDIVKVFSENGKDFPVNIIGTLENPLFQAKHVGLVLDLTNIRASLALLDAEWKVVNTVDTPGGQQQAVFLTEDGLYELVCTSRSKIAKSFRRWVFQVLHDIRTTGRYEGTTQRELELQAELDALKHSMTERGVIYVWKLDRTVPDEACQVKIGMTKNIERRQEPYRQISPNGILALTIEVPMGELRVAENWVHRLLKRTDASVKSEVYHGNLEYFKLVVRVMIDLLRLTAHFDDIGTLAEIAQVCNRRLRGEDDSPDAAPSKQFQRGDEILQRLTAIELSLKSRQATADGDSSKPEPEVHKARKLTEEEKTDLKDPAVSKIYDIQNFIRECCELGDYDS